MTSAKFHVGQIFVVLVVTIGSVAFKAKAALAAIKDERTLADPTGANRLILST